MWYYYCPHCGYMDGYANHRLDCPHNQTTKWYTHPIYTEEDDKGWICPKCKRVWSPAVYECEVCNGTSVTCKCETERDIKE